MKHAPHACPSCASGMQVQLLLCPVCHTQVQGSFDLGRYEALSEDNAAFLETFIRCRGNLKDVGTALSISYPTARNRLDGLISALGFAGVDPRKERRREILIALKEGQITTEEAMNLLQGEYNNE